MGFTPFTAHVEWGQGAARIALSGALDLATVPILEEHLVRVETAGVRAGRSRVHADGEQVADRFLTRQDLGPIATHWINSVTSRLSRKE